MLPLLTFASGLVAGIVGIRLLKTVKTPESLKAATGSIGDKARHGIDQAQTGLRQATVSSLSAIEKSSASLRAKLTPEPKAAPPKAKPAIRKVKAKAAVSEAPAKPAAKRRAAKAKPAPEAGS